MRPITYQNFDLYIEPLPQGGCRAKVTASPRGQAEALLHLPAAETASAALSILQEGAGPQITSPPQDNTALLAAATALFAPLLASTVGQLLARSLDAASADGQGLRVRLHLDERTPAGALPWELLPHPGGDRFLALDPHTPIVRYIDLADAERPLVSAHPLRVLVVLAGPIDLPPIDLEEEWGHVAAALAALQAQGLVEVQRLPTPAIEELQAHLHRDVYHILHFYGHGLLDIRAGEGALAFCNNAGRARAVGAGELAILLQSQHDLRLVFLNACHGAVNQGAAASGVAQRLVRAGLPAVIAMQGAIEAQAAQALTQAFYAGLADYQPVDTALGAARQAARLRSVQTGAALTGAPRSAGGDWALPVLFSRSNDNALLRGPLPDAQPDVQPDTLSQIAAAAFEPPTVFIPAGVLVMGRDAGEGAPVHETPKHTVMLDAYRVGRTPVTNSQYYQFVRETRRAVAPEMGWQLAAIGQAPPTERADHPVVGVTWDDALHYCRWLSEKCRRRYRLPSEAEWERAARGPDGRCYPWGDVFEAQRCNTAEAGRGQASAVGEFSPGGDSPEGVVDLAGNVWEWTSTQWGRDAHHPEYSYPYQAADGREDLTPAAGPLREHRICRGGSFSDGAERAAGSARSRRLADSRSRACGFRVVMEIAIR